MGLYRTIGERLKHAFKGNDAWILSYRKECFDKIGLKASVIIPFFNGALPCEFRKYEMFDGKFKEFRESGEELDKSERPATERRPPPTSTLWDNTSKMANATCLRPLFLCSNLTTLYLSHTTRLTSMA